MPKTDNQSAEAGSEDATAVDGAHVEFYSVDDIAGETQDDDTLPVRPKHADTPARKNKEAEALQRRLEQQRAALAKTASDPATSLPANAKTEKQQLAYFKSLLIQQSGDVLVMKMIAKALDDTDPDQMQALKFCNERILPLEAFQKGKGGGVPKIGIYIDTADGSGGILQEQAHRRRQAAIDVEATEIPDAEMD